MSFTDRPHRRFNQLTGEWLLVSPHRTQRPWQGQQEAFGGDERPPYDPACYLCPGNKRAQGETNPDYAYTHVFTNDFSALRPGDSSGDPQSEGLLVAQPVSGACRVICFSPRHNLTLPEMPVEDIRRVVDVWAAQVSELGRTYRWVQVFENKGAVMGCSNPHPHGQIWAGDFLPNEPRKEDIRQKDYYERTGQSLLMDYLAQENTLRTRVVVENTHWMVVIPYWATWPFETLLLPRRTVTRLPELSPDERDALASILKSLLTRYDNLFNTSFPYSMGWHGAPTGTDMDAPAPYWQLHAHFYPPLLRSATVKKFMVGYEMLGESQRDITPESAAERLRSLSEKHHKEK